MHNPSLACVGRGCCGGVSFSTCSADGTIRLWDLGLQNSKDDAGLGSSNIGPVGATRLGICHLLRTLHPYLQIYELKQQLKLW